MGYSLATSEGNIASWGSTNFYSTLLSVIKVDSATLTVVSEDIDVTGLNAATAASIVGLGSWSVSIKAHAFATPRLGNVGTVTFSSGFAGLLHVDEWMMRAESSGVYDITEFAASAASGPIWRTYRPDYPKISGTLSAHPDSGVALPIPHVTAPGQPSLPTLTLLYGDSATDETVSGSAIVRQLSVGLNKGGRSTAPYEFTGTGNWTAAGTNAIFSVSPIVTPLWAQGGSAVGAMRFDTLAGSRYLTGADSFWKSIQITCNVGQPVGVDIEVQGCGALTPT